MRCDREGVSKVYLNANKGFKIEARPYITTTKRSERKEIKGKD